MFYDIIYPHDTLAACIVKHVARFDRNWVNAQRYLYQCGDYPPNYSVPAPVNLIKNSQQGIIKGYNNAWIMQTIYDDGWLENNP